MAAIEVATGARARARRRASTSRGRPDGWYRFAVSARSTPRATRAREAQADYELDTTPPAAPAIERRPETPGDRPPPDLARSPASTARADELPRRAWRPRRSTDWAAVPSPFTADLADAEPRHVPRSSVRADRRRRQHRPGRERTAYDAAGPRHAAPDGAAAGDERRSRDAARPERRGAPRARPPAAARRRASRRTPATATPATPGRRGEPRRRAVAQAAATARPSAAAARPTSAGPQARPRSAAARRQPGRARGKEAANDRSTLGDVEAVAGVAARAVAAAVTENPDKSVFPGSLILLVVGFLGVQNRIDRTDPKLALAPVAADPDLDVPPPGPMSRHHPHRHRRHRRARPDRGPPALPAGVPLRARRRGSRRGRSRGRRWTAARADRRGASPPATSLGPRSATSSGAYSRTGAPALFGADADARRRLPRVDARTRPAAPAARSATSSSCTSSRCALLASYRTGMKLAMWHSLLLLVVYYAQQAEHPAAARPATASRPRRPAQAARRLQRRLLARRDRDRELLGGQRARAAPAPLRPRGARRSWRAAWRRRPARRAVADVLVDTRRRHVRLRARGSCSPPPTAATLTVLAHRGDDRAPTRRGRPDDESVVAPGDGDRRARSSSPRWTRADDAALRERRCPTPATSSSCRCRPRASAIGVLVVEHPMRAGSRIERRVVGMLERFAAHGALALRNAWLLEEVQHLAATDALTGLANRATFQSALGQELSRAPARRRRRWRSSMLDIDHFKRAQRHATATRPATRCCAASPRCSTSAARVVRHPVPLRRRGVRGRPPAHRPRRGPRRRRAPAVRDRRRGRRARRDRLGRRRDVPARRRRLRRPRQGRRRGALRVQARRPRPRQRSVRAHARRRSACSATRPVAGAVSTSSVGAPRRSAQAKQASLKASSIQASGRSPRVRVDRVELPVPGRGRARPVPVERQVGAAGPRPSSGGEVLVGLLLPARAPDELEAPRQGRAGGRPPPPKGSGRCRRRS